MTMFKNAAKTTTAKPTKAKASSNEVTTIEGVEDLAALVAVLKSLDAIKKTIENEVKSAGAEILLQKGISAKRRPDNLKIADGEAEASLQLKCKSSASKLTPEDIERLTAENIPLMEVDNVTKTFVINPAYAEDEKLLDKVSKALEKVKGLPEDFILMQEDKKTCVDGDKTLDAVFSLKDASKVAALLPLVTTMAIRPTYKGDMSEALELVGGMLGLKTEG